MKNPVAAAIEKGFCKNHRGKMTGMWSFSTSCLDNKYCRARAACPDTVCAHCYADRQLSYQHNTNDKCLRNALLVKDRLLMPEEIPTINPADMPNPDKPFFRWESFGDIETVFQAANYVAITAANPGVMFGWFTKNMFLVDYARDLFDLKKPANLTIAQGSEKVNVPACKVSDWTDIVFTVYSKEFAILHGIVINCGARSCQGCGRCYDGSSRRTAAGPVYVNELLK